MKDTSRSFLDSNRIHLESINKAGYVKNLQVTPMLTILREELDPKYPVFDESNADKIFKMVRDTYALYDKFLFEENLNAGAGVAEVLGSPDSYPAPAAPNKPGRGRPRKVVTNASA